MHHKLLLRVPTLLTKFLLAQRWLVLALALAGVVSTPTASAQITYYYSLAGDPSYNFTGSPPNVNMQAAVQTILGKPITNVGSLVDANSAYPPVLADHAVAPFYSYGPTANGVVKNLQIGTVILSGIVRGDLLYIGSETQCSFSVAKYILRVYTATQYNDILIKVSGCTYYPPAPSSIVETWSFYQVSGPRNIPPPPVAPSLVNLSTRARVLTGQNVLITGMYVQGTGTKRVIIRGIGPSLTGIPGAMANPTIELRNSAGTLIASNDNWQQSAQYQEIVASGVAPTNYYESAIIQNLAQGSYTTTLQGVGGTTGVALVEVYDLDQPANSKLVNLSSRAYVDTGDNAVFAGLIISSGSPAGQVARVAFRGIGPTLGNYGISNSLQDPTLELRNSSGTLVASNNDWQETQAAEIQAAGMAPGDYRESVIIKLLVPGGYSAILRGSNNTVGTGLIELYRLP